MPQSFFNKVAGLGVRPATLLKKRLWHRCFPVIFVKFSRTSISMEHLRWLLLSLSLSEAWRDKGGMSTFKARKNIKNKKIPMSQTFLFHYNYISGMKGLTFIKIDIPFYYILDFCLKNDEFEVIRRLLLL